MVCLDERNAAVAIDPLGRSSPRPRLQHNLRDPDPQQRSRTAPALVPALAGVAGVAYPAGFP
jgi:hypothetical protein